MKAKLQYLFQRLRDLVVQKPWAVAVAVFTVGGGLTALVIHLNRPDPFMVEYKSRLKEIAAYNPQIENLYEGKVEKLRFRPGNGQSLQVSYSLQATAEVNMNFLVAAMNPGTGSKKIDTDKKLQTLFGERQKSLIDHQGVLHLKFYNKSPGLYHVAAVLTDLKYEINHESGNLLEALKQPFAFEMNDRGLFQNFSFMKGVPDQVRHIIRQTVYMMQAGLPEKGKNQWKMKEYDGDGFYQSAYGVTAVDAKTGMLTIVKKKVKFENTMKFSDKSTVMRSLREGRKAVTKSHTTLKLADQSGWVESVKTTDADVSMSRSGRTWGSGEYSFTAGNLHKSSTYKFPGSFNEFVKRLNSNEYLKFKYYETDPFLNSLGQNRDAKQAVGMFRAMLKKNETKTIAPKFILNYLRQNPGACTELIEIIDNADHKDIAEEEQHQLWHSIAKAGHEEAQRAITGAYGGSYNTTTNYRAVTYSHDIENPQPFVVSELQQVFESNKDGDDQNSKELSAMSLLAIGSLGNAEKINEQTRELSAAVLTSYLKSEGDPEVTREVLNAMGNHGSDSLLSAISSRLQNNDEGIRQAAVEALRHIKASDAQVALRKYFETEKSVNLQAGAVMTLAQMPYEEDSFIWIEHIMKTVHNEKIYLAIARYLGTNIENNDYGKTLLADLAEKSKSIQTKTMIYKYIKP